MRGHALQEAAMFFSVRKARVPVAAGTMLHLRNARHARLCVRRGDAWITVEADPRDIVLAAGQSVVLDSDAAVLVYPLRAGGALELDIDAAAVLQPAGWMSRLIRWLRPARSMLAVS
jgi:hypothetical protein